MLRRGSAGGSDTGLQDEIWGQIEFLKACAFLSGPPPFLGWGDSMNTKAIIESVSRNENGTGRYKLRVLTQSGILVEEVVMAEQEVDVSAKSRRR